MTTTETRKAVAMPVIKIIISFPLKAKPNLSTLRRLAPSITGIARKKVNSAAAVLETPIRRAPRIVAPEREVPGKIAAISWNMPIASAVLYVICPVALIFAVFPLFLFSIKMNPMPNRIRASATQMLL